MGEALCEGLVKISVENLGNMVPDTLYSLYHFSHPPLVERLRAVRQIKADVAGTSKKTE
jgi:STE24 endopeptidase